ncbi:MAG: helix-turn-helix domain-containing protein [Dehalococcoidia bacterium]
MNREDDEATEEPRVHKKTDPKTPGRDSDALKEQDISIAEAYSKALAAYGAYLRAYIDASKLGSKLTIKKAADFLGVHRTTLRRWSDTGLIEHERSGRREERTYLPEYIIRFLETRVDPILDTDSEALKRQTIEAYARAIAGYRYYISTYIDASTLGPKLTIRKAAKVLGVHVNTLRNWSNEGRIRSYRFGPRGDRRFSLEDLWKSSKGRGQPTSYKSDRPGGNMLAMREVADVLHVHENTVRNWADQGPLKCRRIGIRGDRRFDPVDVKDFAEKMGYPKEDLEHLQNYIDGSQLATTS